MRGTYWLVVGLLFSVAVGAVAGQPAPEIDGVTIPLSPGLEQEQLEKAEEALESSGVDVPSHAYVVVTPDDGKVLVLSDSQPVVSNSTVSGELYNPPDQTPFLLADSRHGTRNGEQVSVQTVRQNASEYHYELVQFRSPSLRVGYTFDPADEGIVYKPSYTGVGESVGELTWTHPGRAARELVKNTSNRDFEGADRVVRPHQDSIPGFASHKRVWWGRSESRVNGVPQGPSGMFTAGKTTIPSERVGDVSEIGGRTGDIVTVNATLRGASLSAQETLLRLAGCGEGMVTFPSTGCAPVPADVVIHSGVAYTGTSSSADETVFYIGLSNTIQSSPVVDEQGEHRVTGRVISASRIDPRLDGTALLILDRERIGDVSGSRPDALPDVDTTALIAQQVVANRSEWARTHPDANTFGTVPVEVTETATETPTSTTETVNSEGRTTPKATRTATPGPTPTQSTGDAEDDSGGVLNLDGLPGGSEIILLSGVFAQIVLFTTGLILTASRLWHASQGTTPPFSRRSFYAVWSLVGLGFVSAGTLANPKLGAGVIIGAGVISVAIGWFRLLRQLIGGP